MKKPWYKSLTIWSVVYLGISLASQHLDLDMNAAAEQGKSMADAVAVLLAVWGRKRADQQLGA